MKILKLRSSYKVYENIQELPEQDQVLLQLAKKSLENSYSPYSNFKVGAAVLLENGRMLGGSNQENASYPMCICAEQVTIATASSQYPNKPIHAMAVTVKSQQSDITRPAAPCGACRQIICESEQRYKQPIKIILQGSSGEVWVFDSILDLLPLAFESSFLE